MESQFQQLISQATSQIVERFNTDVEKETVSRVNLQISRHIHPHYESLIQAERREHGLILSRTKQELAAMVLSYKKLLLSSLGTNLSQSQIHTPEDNTVQSPGNSSADSFQGFRQLENTRSILEMILKTAETSSSRLESEISILRSAQRTGNLDKAELHQCYTFAFSFLSQLRNCFPQNDPNFASLRAPSPFQNQPSNTDLLGHLSSILKIINDHSNMVVKMLLPRLESKQDGEADDEDDEDDVVVVDNPETNEGSLTTTQSRKDSSPKTNAQGSVDQNRTTQLQSVSAQLTVLRTVHEGLEREHRSLQKEMEELREASDEITKTRDVKEGLAALRLVLETLSDEKRRMERELGSCRKQVVELEEIKSLHAGCSDDARRLLDDQKEKSKLEIQKLGNELEKARCDLENTRQELGVVTEERNVSQAHCHDENVVSDNRLEATHIGYQAKLDELNHQNNALQGKVSNFDEQMKAEVEKRSKMKGKCDIYQKRIEDLRKEKDALKRRYENEKATNFAKRQEVEKETAATKKELTEIQVALRLSNQKARAIQQDLWKAQSQLEPQEARHKQELEKEVAKRTQIVSELKEKEYLHTRFREKAQKNEEGLRQTGQLAIDRMKAMEKELQTLKEERAEAGKEKWVQKTHSPREKMSPRKRSDSMVTPTPSRISESLKRKRLLPEVQATPEGSTASSSSSSSSSSRKSKNSLVTPQPQTPTSRMKSRKYIFSHGRLAAKATPSTVSVPDTVQHSRPPFPLPAKPTTVPPPPPWLRPTKKPTPIPKGTRDRDTIPALPKRPRLAD